MQIAHHVPLAPLTSLGVGGQAETLITIETSDEISAVLQTEPFADISLIGYGANVLISDQGLPGITLRLQNSGIRREGNTVIAEGGTWWDDVVSFAIAEQLWGIETMSAIPGGVAAAVVGNVAAYGQAINHTLAWVEVYDMIEHATRRIAASELALAYRSSAFHDPSWAHLLILRAAFELQLEPTNEITYQPMLDTGVELSTLAGRRQATLIARQKAGSLWDWQRPEQYDKTAGSFFRNPLVTQAQADDIIRFDETGKTADTIRKMNSAHSGDALRVSAAHVLLAAGFKRGQTWGPVKLHDSNLLKLQNTGNATASQIYAVSDEIIATVKQKLNIDLTPEVRFLGNFS